LAISVYSIRFFFQTINRDKIEFRRKNLWLNRWRCRRMSFASCPREKDCRQRWLRAAFGELHFNAVKTFAMYVELFFVHARKIRLLIWWMLFWVLFFLYIFLKTFLWGHMFKMGRMKSIDSSLLFSYKSYNGQLTSNTLILIDNRYPVNEQLVWKKISGLFNIPSWWYRCNQCFLFYI